MTKGIPTWLSDFETGIKAIDRDHKALFEEIGNLSAALLRNESPRHVEQAIACLETYVLEHFEREEAFMTQAGYPGTEAHVAKHRALARKVECLRAIHAAGKNEIDPVKLAHFLSEWLSSHIQKSDMDYVPYLRGERDDQDKDVAARLEDVSIKVPRASREVVERFLGIILSADPAAKELTKLVEQFENSLAEREMQEARRLFCAD